jgi:hypothetical protein
VDVAVGVLVLLRRCDGETAYEELLATAVDHRVSLLSLARSLTTLASGRPAGNSPAADVASLRWGPDVIYSRPAAAGV